MNVKLHERVERVKHSDTYAIRLEAIIEYLKSQKWDYPYNRIEFEIADMSEVSERTDYHIFVNYAFEQEIEDNEQI